MKQQLTKALIHRKDRVALEILKAHPELIDETIIGLALEHSCVSVIRYLRAENKITAEGAKQRAEQRDRECREGLDKLNAALPEIEKYFI